MVVTLLMNMFFGGRLKGMPPKLVSDDGQHVVIRPLAYVAEADLERYAAVRQFPIIPCTLCGNQEGLQRAEIKAMIRQWERQQPGRIDNMANAMQRVMPSHLADRGLYPFASLKATGVADPAGDKAFDEDNGLCREPSVIVMPDGSGAAAGGMTTAQSWHGIVADHSGLRPGGQR
jgi:tRNA 2-thiocytidine biosynthesis protein TtcA